jgi:hypothetical protein
MKILVIHDPSGTIVATASVPHEHSDHVELTAGDGLTVTEVDIGALRLPGAAEGAAPDLSALSKHLIAHHRVEHGKLEPRRGDHP